MDTKKLHTIRSVSRGAAKDTETADKSATNMLKDKTTVHGPDSAGYAASVAGSTENVITVSNVEMTAREQF